MTIGRYLQMNSELGILKAAAKRVGLSFDEYMSNLDAGLKRCTLGKHWPPTQDFHSNAARIDGLSTSCRYCWSKYTRTTDGPGLREKRERLTEDGLAWCGKCKKWLPADQINHNRACRPCTNQYARERYATVKRVRQERRQHSHARKRNMKPISPDDQDTAMASTNGHCKYCDRPATTFDHVIPVSKGGPSTIDNIVPACVFCNSSKKDRNVDEWLAQRKESA